MATIYDKMTAIANAIRSKTGYSGKLTLDQMATQINSIETQDSLIERKATKIVDSKASYVASYAFFQYGDLQEINLPNAISIYTWAFNMCPSLTSVSLPKVTTINDGFDSAVSNKIKYAYLPKYSFYNFPIGTYMESLTLGTSICSNIIYRTNLKYVYFPNATSIVASCFYSTRYLSGISFPNVTTIGSYAFYNCSSLTSVSFPKVSTIYNSAFYGCSNLSKIVLNNSTLCSLKDNYTFYGTKIHSKTGGIYVPSSLVNTYKQAAYWSQYSTIIYSI